MSNLNHLQQQYSIVYQIHRDGITSPISYAQLKEPWSDHLYYFSTIQFKKSGKFTVSFLVEGAGNIKPLIYPVQVFAQSIRCGIPDALDRLVANDYFESPNRQVYAQRRELIQYLDSPSDELSALKAVLIRIFLALPFGSLTSEDIYSDIHSSISLREGLIEPSGWNACLEQTWRGAVMGAQCPMTLMECVLILEFYIEKGWMNVNQSRLNQGIPSYHFAIRSATFSSVALRLYSLDRMILYEKVATVSREKRRTSILHSYQEDSMEVDYSMSNTSSRRAGRNSDKYHVEEEAPRSRRAAATAASQKLQNYRENKEDEDDENFSQGPPQATFTRGRQPIQNPEEEEEVEEQTEGVEDDNEDDNELEMDQQDDDNEPSESDEDASYKEEEDEDEEAEEADDSSSDDDEDEVIRSDAKSWTCPSCETINSMKARSCENCDERKPSVEVLSKRKNNKNNFKSRTKSSKDKPKKSRKYNDSDDSDEDEEFDEDEVDDDDDDENDNESEEDNIAPPSKRPRRSISQIGYAENENNEESELEVPSVSKTKVFSQPQVEPSPPAKSRSRKIFLEDDEEAELTFDDEIKPTKVVSKPKDISQPSPSIAPPIASASTSIITDAIISQSSEENPTQISNGSIQAQSGINTTTLTTESNSASKRPRPKRPQNPEEKYKENLPLLLSDFSNKISDYQQRSSEINPKVVDFTLRCLSLLKFLLNDFRTQTFWEPIDETQFPNYR